MLRLYILAVNVTLVLFSGCGSSNAEPVADDGRQPQDTGKAIISFADYEHNFGQVKEGEKVGYIFSFVNKGTASLFIKTAVTSCGCTVPKFDKEPFPPGDSGTLEVVFNTSGYSGIQTKTIAVHSNSVTPVVVLQIKAEVINNN